MLGKIRRIVGRAEHVKPVIDKINYKPIMDGYAGGSLQGAHIYIVGNGAHTLSRMKEMLKIEKCALITVLSYKECLEKNDNIRFEDGGVKIINLIEIDAEISELDVQYYYSLIQRESSIFAYFPKGGTICTCMINYSTVEKVIAAEYGILSLLSGLAARLSNCNIILNGVLAEKNVVADDVIKTVIFLCSKYGDVLTGEMLYMQK